MKSLPGPSNELTPGDLPSKGRREIIGNQVDLPGRYRILTDGRMVDLVDPNAYPFDQQPAVDTKEMAACAYMIARMLTHARTKLKGDGRRIEDWKYTVTIAIHHKGQATEFWLGDGPEHEVRVDQSLEVKLRRTEGGQKIDVKKG